MNFVWILNESVYDCTELDLNEYVMDILWLEWMNVLDVEEGRWGRWMEMISTMVMVLGNGDGSKSM